MTDHKTGPDGTVKFRCPACEAPLRYGDRRCTSCDEDAPIYNRRGFWLGLWASLGATAALTIWLMVWGPA